MYNTSKSGENRLRGDKMKQEKFSKVLKTKGFYLSLLTGVLAVAAICFVYFSTSGKDNNKNLTDLNNNPSQQQSANDNNANTPGEDGQGTVVKNTATPAPVVKNGEEQLNKEPDGRVLENDVEKDPNAEADNKDKDDSVAAVNQGGSKTDLSFTQEEELTWPVTGNVIIPYDMEHGVLFTTLGQYKCSDAIVISAKEGTKVKSAIKGQVLEVAENEETGLTVTVDIGSGYSISYGQLKDVKVKKGDMLKTGQVIGAIAQPTKYYVVEGANLYFKVMQDEQPINPMYLLK